MNKYGLDLCKNLPGLNLKIGLYAEKCIYGACYWAFNEAGLESGIEGGANK